MAGNTEQHLVAGLTVTMVDNSPYEALAGQPMPADMRASMIDAMVRLAGPIHEHVVSWWNEEGGGTFPDEKVKMTINDPTSGFLSDKIDGTTIIYDTETLKLKLGGMPLATADLIGGMLVGKTPASGLYIQSNEIFARIQTNKLLSDSDNEMPSSRAVKLYVTDAIQAIVGGGGIGNMLKSQYDTDDNGIVDNAERLEGEAGSYYLSWSNFSGLPTTLAGYGITNAYTKIELQSSGQSQVHWDNISSKPTTLSGYGITDTYTKVNLQTATGAQVHWDNLTNVPGTITGSHHALGDLTAYDDHTQYVALAGRTGGQVLYGSTTPDESLDIKGRTKILRRTQGFDKVWRNTSTTWVDYTSAAASVEYESLQPLPTSAYKFYLGKTDQFSKIYFYFVTLAVGQTTTFEYSQGSGNWGTLTATDNTVNFTVNQSTIEFTPPGDWATDTVNGTAGMYWIRLGSSTSSSTDANLYTITADGGETLFEIWHNTANTYPALGVDKNGWVSIPNIKTPINTQSTAYIASTLTTGSSILGNSYIRSYQTSIADTKVTGFYALTGTAATAGIPVQRSPLTRWMGYAWNTTPTAVAKYNGMDQWITPVSGATTYPIMVWSNAYVDGVVDDTELMWLSHQGKLSILSELSVNTISEYTAANGVWIDGLGIKDTGINFEVGATTRIFKDGSNNLSFTDAVTGTKTLADLVGGGSMVYPAGSGIPIVVSGTSWGTTITDNSTNWNTAYGWGNHSGLYANLSHTHGDISNDGKISSTAVTPATGDYLILTDTSASEVLKRGVLIGTGTTTYLRNDGTWGTPAGTYSLPTAASNTLGGIEVGYSATGANIPVALSGNDAYVALTKSAIDSVNVGTAQYQIPITGATPFTPTWTTATNLVGTNGLNSLTYASASFVKMTGANTFTLDTSTYLTSVTAHNLLSATHGDTLTGTVVRGSIIVGNATPKWSALAFPATPTGKALVATATDVAWSAAAVILEGDSRLTDARIPTSHTLESHTATVTTGKFLIGTGTNTFAWSTLLLPNASTTGDIPYASAANTISMLTSVATAGSFLRGGGTGVAPAWSTVKLPTTMSALGIWVANTANSVVNLTAAANQSIRMNSGGTAWEAYTPGTGNVTKVGTPVDNQIGVWTGDGIIEGDSHFTWDGKTLKVDWNNYGDTFIGNGAGAAVTTGTHITAIGLNALNDLQSGDSNVAIGNYAGESCLGSNNIFIGYLSGHSETGSNKLYISCVLTSSTSALIYGEFNASETSQLLRVNGQFQLPFLTGTGTGNSMLYFNRTTGAVTYGDAPAVGTSSQWTNITNGIYYTNRVMIGSTSNPTAMLYVAQTASTTIPALQVASSGTLANNNIVRFQIDGLTNGFRMFQDASSNVNYSFEGGKVSINTATNTLDQLLINSTMATTNNTGLKVWYNGDTATLGEAALIAHRTPGWCNLYLSGSGSSTSYGLYVDGTKPNHIAGALYVGGTTTLGSLTGMLKASSGVVSALANGSSGQFLRYDGTWDTPSTAAQTIYLSNEGSDTTCFPLFSTDATGYYGTKTNASLTYNSSTNQLGSKIILPAAGTTVASPLLFTSGTPKTTAEAGGMAYDGLVHYSAHADDTWGAIQSQEFLAMSSSYAGITNGTALQRFIYLGGGHDFYVTASTTYFFEAMFHIYNLDATGRTIGFGLSGTATFTSIAYTATATRAATGTATAAYITHGTAATSIAITATSSTSSVYATIRGIIRINAAGYITPCFSTSSGSTSGTLGANNYFRLWAIGVNTVTRCGNNS